MKKFIMSLVMLTSLSSFASTYSCSNFGKDYQVTVNADSKIESIQGILKYDCKDHDFNVDGFVGGGPDGVLCTNQMGLSKGFVVTSFEEESISMINIDDIGYDGLFTCNLID